MSLGGGAIGQFPIGQGKAPDAGLLSVTDLETGSPEITTPAIISAGGIDPACVLLLHGDGANASTTIVDSSPLNHTMTANGDAQLTTAQKEFGSASMTFDGAGDYIDTPDNANLGLGTLDFTIDFWFRNTAGAGTVRRLAGHMATTAAADTSFHITLGSANTVGLNLSNGTSVTALVSTTVIANDTWYHFAGVRFGDILKVFINGVQEGGDVVFTGTVPHAGSLAVGRRGDINSNYFTGQVDEFRLSIGAARWTANFTPPTQAYGYDLVALALAPSAPALDTPSATAFYPLTASDLATASPALDTPTLSHNYSVTANDLATGSPVLDAPSASVYYPLTATDLATGSPALDTPNASAFYPLVASDLVTASPVLGTPSLSLGTTIPADDLETGSPVLDTPAAAVFYALTANSFTPSSPDLDEPALMYGLVAVDLDTGAPDLGEPIVPTLLFPVDLETGAPVLGTPGLATLIIPVLDLITGAPVLDTPTLSHHYSLFVFDFETASPDLDAAIYRPSFMLLAVDLEPGAPDLGLPECDHQVGPRPELLASNIDDLLLDPIYASIIGHPARLFPGVGGLPAIDLTVINHTEAYEFDATIGVETIHPHVDVRVKELAIYGVERRDLNGGQIMLWPDTAIQELWNIEDVGVRAGIWGEPSGELRIYLMDRQA